MCFFILLPGMFVLCENTEGLSHTLGNDSTGSQAPLSPARCRPPVGDKKTTSELEFENLNIYNQK